MRIIQEAADCSADARKRKVNWTPDDVYSAAYYEMQGHANAWLKPGTPAYRDVQDGVVCHDALGQYYDLEMFRMRERLIASRRRWILATVAMAVLAAWGWL